MRQVPIKLILLLLTGLILVAGPCSAQEWILWSDSFEGGVGPAWQYGPYMDAQNDCTNPPATPCPKLEGASNHVRTGSTSAYDNVNFRVAANSQRVFDGLWENIYATVWMFEDNDLVCKDWAGRIVPCQRSCAYGHPCEQTPNGFLQLDSSFGEDLFRVGIEGYHDFGLPTAEWSNHFMVETKAEGKILFNNAQYDQPSHPWYRIVHRRQGWRKLRIEVHPFTPPDGAPGDVRLFVDDVPIYEGLRMPGYGGGTYIDRVILGGERWTGQPIWFDDVEVGILPTTPPVQVDTIAEAKALPDGTFVEIAGIPVLNPQGYIEPPHTIRADPPIPPRGFWFWGFNSIGELDRSAGIRVLTTYPADLGQNLRIIGRMETTGCERVLNAFEITPLGTGLAVPDPVYVTQKWLGQEGISTEGMLVRVAGRVIQPPGEEPGIWRRYLVIDDGSALAGIGGPGIKVYYNNAWDAGLRPGMGSFIVATGIVGRNCSGSNSETVVYVRRVEDLRVL